MNSGNNIPADIAGHRRIEKKPNRGVSVNSQLGRLDHGKVAAGRDVGCLPDKFGVQAQQQVAHHGVAGGHDIADIAGADHHRPTKSLDNGIDGLYQFFLEGLQATGPLRINDPGDHVFAVGDLAVIRGGLGERYAGVEINQHPTDRGGADIHRQAVKLAGGIPRLHGDDAVSLFGPSPLEQCHRDAPVGLPQSEG